MSKRNILTRNKKIQAERLASGYRWEEAMTLYESICKIDPTDTDALTKLAAIRFRLGQYEEAESYARRALLLAPNMSFARQTLATILQHQGKLDEASSILQELLALQPNSSESLINLAHLREEQGRVNEAFHLYHRALDLQPESLYVLAKRAELLEKEGRLPEAEAIIARGLVQMPGSPILNLAAARLDRRMNRHAEAAARLEKVLGQQMPQDTHAEIHLLLGQLHDRLGNTGKVLPHLLEGKSRMAQATDPDGSKRIRFLSKCNDARALLNNPLVVYSQVNPPLVEEAPIFLIGFPRSGTTLLEQVLDSHPSLQTLDEKPMADIMERTFLGMAKNQTLADLSEEQIAALRHAYFNEAARHVERQPGTLLVDKLPLNIIRVPLLWRVFPEARFILAIRHPCDVILSCLMQNFGINDAMIGFTSLESSAEIYAHVMSSWHEYEKKLPLHWQRIRYEDLITDFESEIQNLLDFLGVGWNDAVLEHTQHAQQRGIINTPSYHQVTQPIYQHAKYRWKNYQNEFASAIKILQPFIERFGYQG